MSFIFIKTILGAKVVMITRLGRTALYCYSVITIVMGCIPFFKQVEMEVEGRTRKKRPKTCWIIFQQFSLKQKQDVKEGKNSKKSNQVIQKTRKKFKEPRFAPVVGNLFYTQS